VDDQEDPEVKVLKIAIRESLLREQYETFATLTFAAREGDVEVVRNLLRLGAEIDAADYDGRTALAMVFCRVHLAPSAAKPDHSSD
jgi:ankyrin repeat protein